MIPFHYSSNTHILLYIHLHWCSWPRQSYLYNRWFHRRSRCWVYSVLHHTQWRSHHRWYPAGEQSRPWCSPFDCPEVSCRMDNHTLDRGTALGNKSGCSGHWEAYCTGWWSLSGGWLCDSQLVSGLLYLADSLLNYGSSPASPAVIDYSGLRIWYGYHCLLFYCYFSGCYFSLCMSHCRFGVLNYLQTPMSPCVWTYCCGGQLCRP